MEWLKHVSNETASYVEMQAVRASCYLLVRGKFFTILKINIK